jgi:hypothetical protein
MPSADLAARIAEEAARLPLEKQSAVLDFVLFMKQRVGAQSDDNDDAAWERIIEDPTPRPKLEAFLREAAAEGEEPLDMHRL